MHPNQHHPTPDKDAIALLPPFERLGLERIELVTTAEHARQAFARLCCSWQRRSGRGCFSCTMPVAAR